MKNKSVKEIKEIVDSLSIDKYLDTNKNNAAELKSKKFNLFDFLQIF